MTSVLPVHIVHFRVFVKNQLQDISYLVIDVSETFTEKDLLRFPPLDLKNLTCN